MSHWAGPGKILIPKDGKYMWGHGPALTPSHPTPLTPAPGPGKLPQIITNNHANSQFVSPGQIMNNSYLFGGGGDIHLYPIQDPTHFQHPPTDLTMSSMGFNQFPALPFGHEIPHRENLVEPMVHRLRGEVLKPTPHLPPCKSLSATDQDPSYVQHCKSELLEVNKVLENAPVRNAAPVEYYNSDHISNCQIYPKTPLVAPFENHSNVSNDLALSRRDAGGQRPYVDDFVDLEREQITQSALNPFC